MPALENKQTSNVGLSKTAFASELPVTVVKSYCLTIPAVKKHFIFTIALSLVGFEKMSLKLTTEACSHKFGYFLFILFF